MMQYACTCGGGHAAHVHTVSPAAALRRGVHAGMPPDCAAAAAAAAAAPAAPAAPAAATSAPPGTFAASLRDAIEGALLGLAIGDALAAPLHWVYTWPQAQRLKREHYGGGLTGYAASPPAGEHPDSHRYFSRCSPARAPVAAVFGPPALAAAWARPGAFYHAPLPPGDSSLSARLVTRLAAQLGERGGLDAGAWFARGYLPLLQRQGGPAASHGDLWVDEAHRVLFENLARGAAPWEAGMDDLCLTGINLATPLLLAYRQDRDAQELAARCLLQLTHKNEDMVQQCLWWGDLLRALLPSERAAASAPPGAPAASAQDSLAAVFASFSPLRLREVLAAGLTPEQVYHGDAATGAAPIFSSR
jgi:hypothetical protein